MAKHSIHPVKIFYCYTHEDDGLREQLVRHLSPLRRLRDITGWFDRDIQAGTNWEQETEAQMDSASIILLLISADFIASDYCYTVEMKRALEKHKAGKACVIPILLRSVKWENTPFGELSPLPTNKMPVTQWADRDEAWLNVVEGISEVVRKLLPKQYLSPRDVDLLYPEQGPLSGQTIGNRYLLGELLGEGGFAQVYKAQHLQIKRQQAIKVLLERYFRKPAFRDRFLREAQTVASLEHPSIIHLDDFWVEAPQAYLVMPFMSGGTLQDILEKQQGFLERDQIISYLEDICAALDYAHTQGVVHLDLKPLNLLVHENGRLLLSDFGLAHLMKQGVIEGGSSLKVGTPHFMAPEHIKGSPERRSDLFSLGVILYQMLVGRLPFDGLPPETIMMKNMAEWPPAPRTFRPELPQAVQDMLGKALAKQPEQRYQTANEFLIAFKNAFDSVQKHPTIDATFSPLLSSNYSPSSLFPVGHQQQLILADPMVLEPKGPLPPRPTKSVSLSIETEKLLRDFEKALKSRRADKIAAAYNNAINVFLSPNQINVAIMSKDLVDSYKAYNEYKTNENLTKFFEIYDWILASEDRDIVNYPQLQKNIKTLQEVRRIVDPRFVGLGGLGELGKDIGLF